MRIFEKDGRILAKLITPEDWTPGLGFFSNDNEYIQVGTWFYDAGKQLADHVHYEFDRVAKRTCETVYMVNGSMKVRLYTLEKVYVTEFVITKGDALILLDSGHGYEILEKDTKVLEIKNGPFMGVDKDKEKF
ncbi:MAG: hypothetical protein PHT30_00270 [Bacilli bacterium]|nr:hypothetical protein [Bacilli bacterium]